MDIKAAIKKAKPRADGARLVECYDIGDRWAFYFDDADDASGGVPFLTVDKQSGKVDTLPIPPIENLHRIQNGKRIDITKI